VHQTEAGLRELGLNDVAEWFTEAHEIMQELFKAVERGQVESPGDEYYDWLIESSN
jgi:hypothetical protein